MFAFAQVLASVDEARAALRAAKKIIRSAYVKRCETRPGSLLELRIPAVDPSIADIPAGAVNWKDADRSSEVRRLSDGRTLVIVRQYVNAKKASARGRRERVVLAESREKKTTLENDCLSPDAVALGRELLVFDCVREQVGDHLMRTTLVFDSSGKRLKELPRCRNPKITPPRAVTCVAESVLASGALELRTVRTEFR
jgi:hypothetical protein